MKTPIFKNISAIVLCCLIFIFISGCKKYLAEKSNSAFAVPDNVSDLQALLDYYPTMNNKDPGSGEISTADYYLIDANYTSLSTEYFRNMYTWQKANLFAPGDNEWLSCYSAVYVSNTVLDNLKNIDKASNPAEWNNVKGQALTFRAKNFLQIAAIWTLAYDPVSAQNDLGIPLRLNSDFNEKSIRSNNQQTYDQIINDLLHAIPLLPNIQVSALRPSKAAAYGLMARTYLWMRQYDKAGLYADSCLQLSSKLMDFNTLKPTATYPVARFNAEVIFDSYIPTPAPINPSRAKIDPGLYGSYSTNDLRKTVFYKDNGNGSFAFKGSYEGGATLFSGVATDEMYLIRAEAFARQQKVTEAMNDLNTLLKSRWKGAYTNFTAANSTEAINLILNERRKELLMRGLYWMDIKRLNKESGNISLSRTTNGVTYTLSANDLRFALPIPEDVVALSGMQQNPR